ncbi:hypothetical protein A2422_00885 [Candidatus Woesebacteria bacterium RIFOXYC1_FULL_31_51]|uniref:Glycosyltransferase n=1 Tax=Candidatus Woesebacteria bacterium GW2011_GWC2_31_9 TaxID=1618586 RepID=A0A0F9YL58_9BACT|nr:MAG: GT4A5, glycosyltransferase, CAZy family GT4, alpha-1,3/alpha-1,6-mannosyltransferase [Candidatus Woesebacteria bacterium GW2011_GWF1_31_35]KKP22874.1 MAG: Glycosyltransferase [Candidatus Woesebacteria bacterium GW2011_GWC1_30_29]KKP26638.1 MAG: Glycosyltransferase [Candidatus Woesebacteria bacterium GW2011_GWD1_31_12]KKP28122.1 MAG: Glycosyltransferase [Candidatus Woesebacteria bacterium GW2011_GWB1_31_29]KKP32209.1 MAG: Glycosyltransferase [Candidatus Woesebacteria bacterium GW2011_GWC
MNSRSKITKIAVFHSGFIYTGGGERIVMEEVKGLREKGYIVDLFVPNYDPTLSYPDIIGKWKVKTFIPQLPRNFPLRFAIQLVISCLAAPFIAGRFKKYDVFLGANQPGAYMAWVITKILKKPYFVYLSQPNRVLYPRDHEDWQNVKDYYFLSKIINSIFRKVVIFLDTKSITESENLLINGKFVAKEIIKIYGPSKWTDCPGGAKPGAKSILSINRMIGQIEINGHTPQKPYILYTSRHEPWKRFDWAIEVMSKVIKKYPDVRLVIPGASTTVTPKLKLLSEKLGIADRVIFTGTIKDKSLFDLYQNAYTYIFTSPKEDLGVVVEEAQAAGTPVVAWNAGGPTVTVVDGKTGFLCTPFNKNEMAGKIVDLLNNPKIRDKMGNDAWKHIKDNFSWKKHVNIIEKLFLLKLFDN